jgi:hypothetical protein
MAIPENNLTDIKTAKPTEPADLDKITERIKAEVTSLENSEKDHLRRAMKLGDDLRQIKGNLEHGTWLAWLTKCGLNERKAQRYMELAAGRAKLNALKSDTMSDLTINAALRLIKEPVDNGGGSASDRYDKVQETLIKKLKELPPENADAAASVTIKKLKDTVATMKQAAQNAAKAA